MSHELNEYGKVLEVTNAEFLKFLKNAVFLKMGKYMTTNENTQ